MPKPDPALHLFEGEQLTIAEIQQRVPVLSKSSVRGQIKLGRRTRQEMLNTRSQAFRSAIGRKGRAVGVAHGLREVFK